MATITKRILVARITEKISANGIKITNQITSQIVQTILDEIAQALAQADRVVLRNFGDFRVRERKAILGRNPRNPKVTVKIPAQHAVKFKPRQKLTEKVLGTWKNKSLRSSGPY